MASFEYEVTISSRLSEVAKAIRQEVKAEIYQFGEDIMRVSKERVPVDTGTLMGSGHVELPVENGDEIMVELGYGGPAAPYALAVHEMMDNVHWTRPGSGPKYLENPLKEMQGDLPTRISDAVKRATE